MVWLLCQSSLQYPYGSHPNHKTVYFDGTTFGRTLEIVAASNAVPGLGAQLDPENVTRRPELTPLDKMVQGQKPFLLEALEYDSTNILGHVYSLIFNMTDTRFVTSIFKRLFTSLWFNLSLPERQEVEGQSNEI